MTFRLHRIVALDPARPLVTPGLRLSSGNALAVHVLHTNAGNYGEAGKTGHVDFCINGGRIQPYCENADSKLCFNFNNSLLVFVIIVLHIVIYTFFS